MRITGIYAAAAVILILVLTVRVILRRREKLIGINDGDDHELRKRIRAHANAVEYLPIGLILLLIIELNQTQVMLVHLFGTTLLAGRVLHAIGISKTSKQSFGRAAGMMLTLLALLSMAVFLFWQFVTAA
jgi:uncharacterized membrane protein YecN with MAPEG domain